MSRLPNSVWRDVCRAKKRLEAACASVDELAKPNPLAGIHTLPSRSGGTPTTIKVEPVAEPDQTPSAAQGMCVWKEIEGDGIAGCLKGPGYTKPPHWQAEEFDFCPFCGLRISWQTAGEEAE